MGGGAISVPHTNYYNNIKIVKKTPKLYQVRLLISTWSSYNCNYTICLQLEAHLHTHTYVLIIFSNWLNQKSLFYLYHIFTPAIASGDCLFSIIQKMERFALVSRRMDERVGATCSQCYWASHMLPKICTASAKAHVSCSLK